MSSNCPHVGTIGDNEPADIRNAIIASDQKCQTCHFSGVNLWLCLYDKCLFIGCGETSNDHSDEHSAQNKEHSLVLNLSSLRVWCNTCNEEVFLDNNDPPIGRAVATHRAEERVKRVRSSHVERSRKPEEHFGLNSVGPAGDHAILGSVRKPVGLSGLQNLGNSCYMNSALQALSNCPPLTSYFVDCGGFVRTDKKPGVCKLFQKFVLDEWSDRRPNYLVPSNLSYGFKTAYPAFRGFTQQDTQEFLRCFLDQIHEELKEPVPEYAMIEARPLVSKQEYHASDAISTCSSQSEGDFETCDSGVPSERCSQDSLVTEADKQENILQVNHKPDKVCNSIGETQAKNSMTSGDTGVSTQSEVDSALRCLEKKRKRKKHESFRSIVSDVFDGKILSSVQCLTCDGVSMTREVFQDLSLPIPSKDHLNMLHSQKLSQQQTPSRHYTGPPCGDLTPSQGWFSWIFSWMSKWIWGPTITLQDCLAAFFSADELKGDNMYSCERCKKLRNGMKYSKVLQLPEVLCVHLKRFRHEIVYSSKIATYISFPSEGLDMKPFLHRDCKSEVMTYDLMAVICHHGTVGGGHYTCYALNCMNDHWYEFDDQYVTEVDVSTVENCEAYVLFYKKRDTEMYKHRQMAIDLQNSGEDSLMDFYISKQWLNQLNTFSEPGPISNFDFLCQHGGVIPQKSSFAEDLCQPLPQRVWEYLHEVFGGGPACNHLYVCPTCQTELDRTKKRQNFELENFMKMHKEFQATENPNVLYALNMAWFRMWENFVRGKQIEPPGPIDNQEISQTGNLDSNSDFGQLSAEMWKFFVDIYGGGPELPIQIQQVPTACSQTSSEKSEDNFAQKPERDESESSKEEELEEDEMDVEENNILSNL